MATKAPSTNLLRLAPKQLEVAVRALHLLGGAHRAVDTEDVAIKSHEIAPKSFAWRKYPDQVNLELVRVALSDAKKSSHGVLVSGSGRNGWRLTTNGVALIAARAPNLELSGIEASSDHNRRSAGSIDTVRKKREEQRIVRSVAWEIWKSDGRVDEEEARRLLRIDSYTSSKLIDVKIARLMELFSPATEVGGFLEAIRETSFINGDMNA